MKHQPRHHLAFATLRLEGGLFLPDQLEKAALGAAQFQSEADYHTPKGLKLKDDISRAFQIATAQWKSFADQFERSDVDVGALTRHFVQEILRDAFGYNHIAPVTGLSVGDQHYPVTFLAGALPVVVAPHTLGLDAADPRFAVAGNGARKKTAFQLAQEFLNASPDQTWAIVSNGRQLRLLRDADTLTRPSFLEVDLQDLLGGARYAEFANVWRLLHASRAPQPAIPPESGEQLGPCIWEQWRVAGQEEGTRVREGLRQGVTEALLIFGEGFIQHPANEALRQALDTGTLSADAYFQQLLRLIYRLIFLFNVEERGLLHPADDSATAIAARSAYAEGYAVARLRDLCLKRRARNRFDDHWQTLRIVFKGLSEGEPRLALPALGGLFAVSQCPKLDTASLDNAHLLAAMQQLRWSNHSGSLAPVDYRNMGPEELGSVYESLLELVPDIDLPARKFGFIGMGDSEGSTAGNARKLTGSYYTPDALVQELIRSTLDPVIAQRLAAQPANPIEALLAMRVIDPACGSGHFLLAAARRLAEQLAQLRAADGAVQPQDYRHALREVIVHCIFGVDRNPMAIELARTALWLEGFEDGRPLSFLDHHLQVGDALLGLTDLKALEHGIPKEAFKPLSGDDKAVCKALAQANAHGLKQLERDLLSGQHLLRLADSDGLAAITRLEALPQDTPTEIAAKEAAWREVLQQAQDSRLAHAADLLVGAFLLPKTAASASSVPTSQTVYLELFTDAQGASHQAQRAAAHAACVEARVLHWPLAFPQVFAAGGFDCVFGNPPWERIKLQEEEFFATRNRDVAEARNKAERSQRIGWLAEGMLARHLFPELEHPAPECAAEQRLYAEFITARRTAEAMSLFAHVNGEDGGRYPLTGVGDVNTYALFAETFVQLMAPTGRAGFIVPTGIATDDSTKAFFAHITQNARLVSLYDIENREAVFPAVHRSYKFCLLTLGQAEQAEFVFFATRVEQLADQRRRFRLTPDEFRLLNPNTLTCPVFRSAHDAELTKKLYRAAPVLIDEQRPGGNPWGIRLGMMFHMSNDSYLFNEQERSDFLPLYEGKMCDFYDHRAASYETRGSDRGYRVLPPTSLTNHQNPAYRTAPFYWVSKEDVKDRLPSDWNRLWLPVFKKITAPTNERTFLTSLLPYCGVGDSMNLVLPALTNGFPKIAALVGNLAAITLDYVARQKIGGVNTNYFHVRQLPVISPEVYTDTDLSYIVPRVLELTYTAHDLAPWARDLGYDGEPFAFDTDRRAQLRAELDAYYARLYGLTRDELRYILDPSDIMGEDYPSETFRVLKKNEEREFGEYRTQRLVLAAWDMLQNGSLT
ncbi:N-6 DNA methylase [Acidithiobacillus sp. HP-6]|uniref:Eco57I restriction-modification methylase domain-containing protein n=1 Tax=unclassified Acidithiobacillus TaxID=2614800 RepID=UPI00187ADF2C|nr:MULTISPECIES: DNA methyltransferase [unclassified Acidithiobacillus]MBE7563902.1 N-6 DNA methylase [Acidithiobacillus sp. HP-6]MBE7569060.1 N-6 DNA methylase [Acidithiobacillus sp. HP-2]